MFYRSLIQSPPPVSKIEQHYFSEIDLQQFTDFRIVPSTAKGRLSLRLTPDFALCEACKEEINDPNNRRFQYPFTTCIHCGPRWAITKRFPFDRETTSMSEYKMCPSCKEEHTSPANRRFHSQTNSCTTCGIQLQLMSNSGSLTEGNSLLVLPKVAQLLEEGHIIAIKNTSGYLLCCHAEKSDAVNRLRVLKRRPKKPFAILYTSLEKLQAEIPLNAHYRKSFASPERPIVILPLERYRGAIALEQIAPGLNQLGVMLPYTALLQLLAKELDFPIVATSGNIHGSPIISEESDALEKLSEVADYFVQHDLHIEHPQDDSVLKYSFKHHIPILFRRSRGYAPNIFIQPKTQHKKLLAMGADLKSTLCFLPNDHMYLSQYLGNLENFDVYERFTQETQSFLDLFQTTPEIILVDKHPKYFSTSYGRELADECQSEIHEIQHHKAHFASVLGEHDLFTSTEKILGVIWDGVGYGEDGQIWGGEFFDYQNGEIQRIGHFEYFDWLAGDKMSKEPRLSLFSVNDNSRRVLQKFSDEELGIYKNLKEKNKLKTSSVGRLFDAVASLLGICDFNTYEGEASILLENNIHGYELSSCRNYFPETMGDELPTKQLVSTIEKELNAGVPKEQIIINFLYSLARGVYQFANRKGYTSLCFSGGVFQNATLLDLITDLNTSGHSLYFNRELSPNDENISFGQAMYFLNCKTS